MKKWGILAGIGVALYAFMSMAMCESGTWRYRMTVEVETPEGVKTGSAVREVTVQRGIKLTPESRPVVRVRGEAVVVDLGERGKLFALLKNANGPDYSYNVIYKAFPWKKEGMGGEHSAEGIRHYSQLKNVKTELSPELMPMMVAFSNLKDPKSVKLAYKVDMINTNDGRTGPKFHEEVTDHLAELFGEGVKLKSITIEMTEDEVTSGIMQVLPWLSEYYQRMFDGQRFETVEAEDKFSNKMNSGYFSTELSPYEP